MVDLSDTLTSAGVREDPLFGTPYRTVAALGRGGMGEVIEAEHIALGRRVVVKLVHEHLAGDPRFAERLKLEARSLSLLAHPNVVAVSDLGETPAGRPYLVLERLRGRTLGEALRARGALPGREAIGVVRQVLAGLEAAHAQGIVHRDVKADNVFWCDDGTVKLLDFGVAKVCCEGTAPPNLASLHPTREGELVGSPRTLAPEQARGGPIDARTDVYGAGLLLYTLVAGRGPFAHLTSMTDVLRAHVQQAPPPPSEVARAPVDPALERAVLKALAKAPGDRFPTAARFAEELARIEGALAPEAGGAALPTGARPARESPSSTVLLQTLPRALSLPHTKALPRAAGDDTSDDRAARAARRARVFAVAAVASAVIASLLISLAFRLLGGVLGARG